MARNCIRWINSHGERLDVRAKGQDESEAFGLSRSSALPGHSITKHLVVDDLAPCTIGLTLVNK